ncbi:MAG: NAD(P)/FAD-dependent oxidoreductase [Synergistaceae bacterium]|jgi:glycerol-3-phosphate dehydrogenase|nr:NAD(P)/FAD-dependent oxidoreductase [Synergistaceae bacterium]
MDRDVAIIGCGIVGAAVAYELAHCELDVEVIEKENDVAMGTSRANSAILHAGYDPAPGTLMAKLNVEGLELAKKLCGELNIPFRECGSMVIAFTEEEVEELKRLYERGVQNGVSGMRLLSGREALKAEPNLNGETRAALLALSAAIVSPWEYALSLAENAVANGVKIRFDSEVTGIDRLEGGFAVHTASGTVSARCVVNAAGLNAERIHNCVAAPSFSTLPDRGEYFLLDKSEGHCVEHVIFQCPTKVGKGTLVSPTVHGNLIVGPNNETPRDASDTATTRQGLDDVAHMAKKSVPSLNIRESIRNFAGVRAATDVDDFIIRHVDDTPGFIDLAGVKSPGLTAAPAIAKMTVALLRECGLNPVEKALWTTVPRPRRFSEMDADEKRRLLARDSSYGRVICRCETVTEGEIRDALRSVIPPRSVDGVKRRCGTGMGRCQGGFCAPRVVDLLARHYGVSPVRIPQDRSGMYLLTGETKTGEALECTI